MQTTTVRQSNSSSLRLTSFTLAGIVATSALYFADILLKASRKCFWFDELFTTYLCGLPKFHDTWTAVTHGADFNPPLFYLTIRWAQHLFGNGLLATRLPSAVGVWLFGLSLFLFVARRAGAVCGFIAAAFPFFTLVQYYSYEARAHGLVLGWLGLALICWQKSTDPAARFWWSLGFGLSVAGALLTHIYAVYLLIPFGVVEIYGLLNKNSRRWRILAALTVAFFAVAGAVYLPLVRQYRAASMPANYFPASHELIQKFLVNTFSPAMAVFLLMIILDAFCKKAASKNESSALAIPPQEMLLALAFLTVPFVGFIGCKLSHGPFLDRYFLSSVAGIAILLGFGVRRLQGQSWAVNVLAGSMFLLMALDAAATVYLSWVNRLMLEEPSTSMALSTNPSNPMDLYESLSTDRGLDIMVVPSLDYLYFYRYAKPSVVSHLYFWAPPGDVNLGGYERLSRWAHLDLKITTMTPFLQTHDKFLVYTNAREFKPEAAEAFGAAGFVVRSAHVDRGGILYEYEKKPGR